jgi:hypothetical protein
MEEDNEIAAQVAKRGSLYLFQDLNPSVLSLIEFLGRSFQDKDITVLSF